MEQKRRKVYEKLLQPKIQSSKPCKLLRVCDREEERSYLRISKQCIDELK